ncbi:efflux transporter outer membrane subunit [Pusillimonas caeni]|uniref:efflux transporter outer membrane subunit n=1 Tax=Pusillimonas caeni TaxID=1348472 RepID=UPI001ADDBB25|nr:efflux transporter outer membrane subunit [Pusillimonas caeni]
MKYALLPSLAVILAGCSLTPPLMVPPTPVAAVFPGAELSPDAPSNATHTADLGWRTLFPEPRLQEIISLALENNRDLRLATLNVEAVQAQFRIQRAARLPGIDANGGATRERIAAGRTADGVEVPSSVQEQASVGIGLSAFELDLFGRVRALSQAALARYLASEEGRRAAQITLVAAVADAYFAERLAQAQLQLAESTLEDWRHSLRLAIQLREADQNSGLDVAQAEGQVATAEADQVARQRALAMARNALDLLVGAPLPDDLPAPLALDLQPILDHLPAGLPSDLLTRRPDIQRAEQALVAANADIGAARAAFFPRISLTAALGFASPTLGGLFDADQRTWRFAPQITVPLFQGGRLRAELDLAEVRSSQAVVEYEQAIQVAFREVADGLAGQATFGRQMQAQQRVVSSAQRRLELSGQRYRAGLDGRLELLDAQRNAYAAQQALLDLRRAHIGNIVALYKALGGGLTDTSTQASAMAQPPTSEPH